MVLGETSEEKDTWEAKVARRAQKVLSRGGRPCFRGLPVLWGELLLPGLLWTRCPVQTPVGSLVWLAMADRLPVWLAGSLSVCLAVGLAMAFCLSVSLYLPPEAWMAKIWTRHLCWGASQGMGSSGASSWELFSILVPVREASYSMPKATAQTSAAWADIWHDSRLRPVFDWIWMRW